MFFKRTSTEQIIQTREGNRVPVTVPTTWHLLTMQDGRKFRAKCGYAYEFVLDNPMRNAAPDPATVCKKCVPVSVTKLPDKPPF